jgi:hypothetical protein
MGAGYDIVRRGWFALDVELDLIGMINREGVLTSGSLGLGVNYY